MSLLRKSAILATALCCTAAIPAAASAGSFENGKYISNLGYTCTPPDGWLRLDAATFVAMEDILPDNIRKTKFNRFDVVFFPAPEGYKPTTLDSDRMRGDARKAGIKAGEIPAPGTPEAEEAAKAEAEAAKANKLIRDKFAPTLSVMVIDKLPTESGTELAKSYAEKMRETAKNFLHGASGFKITKSTSDRVHGNNAFLFEMEYRVDQREMKAQQTVLLQSDRSIIITCTSSDNDFLDSGWCTRVVNSFELL